jgi:hypothetical protein
VIRVHEQVRQLVNGAADPGHVTGDSRCDAVTVLGNPRPSVALDDLPLTIELAVAARCVTASEVSEKDQISRASREVGETLPRGLGACDCLWLG